MPREQKAREAVQALIPGDTILDIGLTYPRGFTKAQTLGMSIGGLVGGGVGSGFISTGMVAGAIAGGKLRDQSDHLPPSVVLAVSETKLYTLGRNKSGLVGGWGSLRPLIEFERRTLSVTTTQTPVVLQITLTDTEHGVTLELESKRLSSMGVTSLLAHLDAGSGSSSGRRDQ